MIVVEVVSAPLATDSFKGAPVAPDAGFVDRLRFNQFDFIHGDFELLDLTGVLVGLGHAYDLDSAVAEVSAVLDDFTLGVPPADRKPTRRAATKVG